MHTRILMGAALGLALSHAAAVNSAHAQSYTAPAGIPAATAPGGLAGQAASRNFGAYTGRSPQAAAGPVDRDGLSTTGSLRGTAARRGHVVD